MKQLIIFADGGCRKNGEGVCGVAIFTTDYKEIASISKNLGLGKTSNVAEYTAAILGLEKALELEADEVNLIMDSKICIEQMSGNYTVSAEHLKPLHARACELLDTFNASYLTHVKRHLNSRADQLANLAYTEKVIK